MIIPNREVEKQVSSSELKQLKTVKTVVRQGRVAALHLDKIEFINGTSVPRYCNLMIIISSWGYLLRAVRRLTLR